MRPSPLYNLKQGINRLRIKGGANPSSLYDLVNGWITVDGSISPREGTIRAQTLDGTTHGLMADNGIFNVFSIAQETVPVGYLDNILVPPAISIDVLQATIDFTFGTGTSALSTVGGTTGFGWCSGVTNGGHPFGALTSLPNPPTFGGGNVAAVAWDSVGAFANQLMLIISGALTQNAFDTFTYQVGSGGTVSLYQGSATFSTSLLAGYSVWLWPVASNPFTGGLTASVAQIFTLNTTPPDIQTIWFAKPFMGFPYVVAQFQNGNIFHYWLQNSGTWAANTIYDTGTLILPTVPTGLAYLAQRISPVNPTWEPEVRIALNNIIEPSEYTGYQYKAVAVAGTSPHTGQTEPSWPIVAGGILQEFGDFDTSSTDAGTTQSTATTPAAPLSATITDRYGDSGTIASAGASAGNTLTLPAAASTAVTTWAKGTLYAPGAVVQPSTSQGAFTNAIPNGDFEAGNDGNWILTGGVVFNSTNEYQGTECLQFSVANSDQTATMNTFGVVVPGQSVTASCYFDPHSSGADMTMRIDLRWYNAADVFLSSTQGANQQNGGYRLVSVTGIAPANAAHCRVQLEGTNSTSHTRQGYADLVTWNLATPSPTSNFLFEAVQAVAGSSGSVEPTWPTILGNTVIDNTVTWKAIGTSIITWEAIPIMQSGATQPIWPTSVPIAVHDASTFVDQNGANVDTSISWIASSRQVTDPKCPNGITAALNSSHVFAGDNDIVDFSAAVDPTDWSSANNAGYLPTGLNNFGDNPAAVLALYRSNLMVFNSGGYQMWQTDPDPANMALLDAQPVGSIYTRAAQSVANDLLFLTEVGVRNLATVGATANMQVGSSGQPVDPLVLAQLKASPPTVLSMTAGTPSAGISGYSNGDIPAFGTPTYGSIAPAALYGLAVAAMEWTFASAGNSSVSIALKYTSVPPPDSLITSMSFVGDSATFNLGALGLTTSLVTGTSGALYKVWKWTGATVLPNQTQPFTTGHVYAIKFALPFFGYAPLSLYYPGKGQYWLFFGPQAFVFTVNGQGLRTWSRYTFPDTITDWTLNAGILYLRTAGNLVWQLDSSTVVDDFGGANVLFNGVIQMPYVDVGPLGLDKELIGIDIVGSGQVSIQIGWAQNDPTTLNDQPGFSTSPNVTAAYTISAADTVPGEPIPIPLTAPSFTVIFTFAGNQAWSWNAANLYLSDVAGTPTG